MIDKEIAWLDKVKKNFTFEEERYHDYPSNYGSISGRVEQAVNLVNSGMISSEQARGLLNEEQTVNYFNGPATDVGCNCPDCVQSRDQQAQATWQGQQYQAQAGSLNSQAIQNSYNQAMAYGSGSYGITTTALTDVTGSAGNIIVYNGNPWGQSE